jgi:predicted transcriptional regulator
MIDEIDTKIIQFISDYTAEHRRPPDGTQIAAHVGRSRSVIHKRLHDLKDSGLINFVPHSQNTYTVRTK